MARGLLFLLAKGIHLENIPLHPTNPITVTLRISSKYSAKPPNRGEKGEKNVEGTICFAEKPGMVHSDIHGFRTLIRESV